MQNLRSSFCHFDLTVEQIKSERNLSIDKSIATHEHLVQLRVSNAAAHVVLDSRLDDHEQRLKTLETGGQRQPD